MQANGIAYAVLFSCLLIAASVWDIRSRIIPNSLCLGIVAVGAFAFSPVKLLGILPALLLLIVALIWKDSMGGGDIKLTAASGFAVGLPIACVGLTLGMTLAVFYYLIDAMIRRIKKVRARADRQRALPLAPFLAIGFIAALIIQNLGGTTP